MVRLTLCRTDLEVYRAFAGAASLLLVSLWCYLQAFIKKAQDLMFVATVVFLMLGIPAFRIAVMPQAMPGMTVLDSVLLFPSALPLASLLVMFVRWL